MILIYLDGGCPQVGPKVLRLLTVGFICEQGVGPDTEFGGHTAARAPGRALRFCFSVRFCCACMPWCHPAQGDMAQDALHTRVGPAHQSGRTSHEIPTASTPRH